MKAAPPFVAIALLVLLGRPHVAADDPPAQFREPFAKSWPIRERQHLQMKAYLDGLKKREVDAEDHRFPLSFESAAAYERSIAPVRDKLKLIKGWPPAGAVAAPRPRI